ncbi:hypothetical protein TA3x_001054 [Tundrisphaera sp. TA3]|uniref:hypothetical protein n=1 Tax=Tundrisphaera sp. TA3 TaxID=3435775 RepID=UPI003EB79D5A
MPTEAEAPAPPRLSEHPATAWAILAIAVPVGGWLLWEIHRTIGLDSPRLWELLRTDRVFDLAMLDFVLTASWAAVVWVERARWSDWRAWAAFALFCVVPSLGIAALILVTRRPAAQRGPSSGKGAGSPS